MIKVWLDNAIITVRTSDGTDYSFTWGQLKDTEKAIQAIRKIITDMTVESLKLNIP